MVQFIDMRGNEDMKNLVNDMEARVKQQNDRKKRNRIAAASAIVMGVTTVTLFGYALKNRTQDNLK